MELKRITAYVASI